MEYSSADEGSGRVAADPSVRQSRCTAAVQMQTKRSNADNQALAGQMKCSRAAIDEVQQCSGSAVGQIEEQQCSSKAAQEQAINKERPDGLHRNRRARATLQYVTAVCETGSSEAGKRVASFSCATQGGKQVRFYFRQGTPVQARSTLSIRFPAG